MAERTKLNRDLETTLSYASVMGIKKDIHLVKDDYQWLGSMFYFGGSGQSSRKIPIADWD